MKMRLLIVVGAVAVFVALAWGALRVAQVTARDTRTEIPTTHVKKGRVTIIVAARGELQGGDRKSTRLNSSHSRASRMPSSA